MKETRIIVTVVHKKPLPADFEKVIANRFYNWAMSNGTECGVTAQVDKPVEVKSMRYE